MASRDWSSLNHLHAHPLNDIINTSNTYPNQIAELELTPPPFLASTSTAVAYPPIQTLHYPTGQQPLPGDNYSQLSSPIQPFPAYIEPPSFIDHTINPPLQPQPPHLGQRTFAFQPPHSNVQSYVPGPNLGEPSFGPSSGQWQRQQPPTPSLQMQTNRHVFAGNALNQYGRPAQGTMPMVSSSYAQVLAQPAAPPITRAPTWTEDTFNQYIDPSMCAPPNTQRAAVGAADFSFSAAPGPSNTGINHVGHTMNMAIRNRKPPRLRTPSVVSAASRRTVTPRSRKTSATIYPCKAKDHVEGTICDRTFKTMKKLEYHRRSHDPTYKYACADCEMYFKVEAELTHHRKNVHTGNDAKILRCPQCNKGFLWQPYLDRHLLTHSGTKSFRCLICGDHYQGRFDNLRRHYKNVHPSIGVPKKEECYVAAAGVILSSNGTADTGTTGGSFPGLYMPLGVGGGNVHLAVPR